MGLAIAECLAAEGASVAIMARGQAALDTAVDKLHSSGAPDALGISVDMSDPQSIDRGFATLTDAWGDLNVLVHTVGPPHGPFDSPDDSGWQTAFNLGTMSAVRTVRLALPMLCAASWSRMVTLAAHSIQRQSAGLVAYTASKAALSSLTRISPKPWRPRTS